MSLLSATQTYLSDCPEGTAKQRAEVEQAAADLDAIPTNHPQRDYLHRAFWAWLVKYDWREDDDLRLEQQSRIERSRIEENYKGMYPRFDYNKASESATLAQERRINRCAEHLKAGYDERDCLTFVYARDEWTEAKGKAR